MTDTADARPEQYEGEQRFCGRCGRERYRSDSFCSSCGAQFGAAQAPELRDRRSGARSAARRDNVRSIALIMSVGVAGAASVALAVDAYLYYAISNYWNQIEAGRYSNANRVWAPRTFNAEDIRTITGIVALLLVCATLVALAVWLWRVITVLENRGDYSVGFGRSAAIWSWFIPLVNLVIPPLLVLRASRSLGVRSDIAGWAVLGIVLLPVANVLSSMSSSVAVEDLDSDMLALWLSAAAALALLVGAVLIAQLMSHVRTADGEGTSPSLTRHRAQA